MALVVFLRGVNVGGYRTLRPTRLATQLKHLGAVNIGAAGTFIIRQPVGRTQLRTEFTRRLPFNVEITICPGRDILKMLSCNVFSGSPARPDVIRFVSVLFQVPRGSPTTPMRFPPTGKWLLKILARQNRFVFGVYRRDMKVIGYLETLDRVFGVPVTTRNWNTISAIAKALEHGAD